MSHRPVRAPHHLQPVHRGFGPPLDQAGITSLGSSGLQEIDRIDHAGPVAARMAATAFSAMRSASKHAPSSNDWPARLIS